jgi:vancomycin permeability regulator SanA
MATITIPSTSIITEFKSIKTLALITFAYFLSVGIIWLDGMDSGYQRSDYAVVLGNQVEISGQPSERLAARLGEAKELYRKRMVKKIIVSGGTGKEGYDEARVMRNYLVKHGVPSRKIIVDSKGVNTHSTAQNSKRWIGKKQSVIVVSQLYHLSRSKMAFHNAGFTNVGAAYPDFFEKRDIFASIREVLAWSLYWVAGR